MSSPFDGLSEAEVLERVKSRGEEFAKIFKDCFDDLQKRILGADPLVLLSALSYYALTIQSPRRRASIEESPIQQHGLELLQALLLRHRREEFVLKAATAFDFSKFSDLIEKCAQAFQMRSLAQLDSSLSVNQRLRLRALESIRMHTQVVRNWSYPEQITRIVKSLFEPLDEEIENHLGVRVSHLIDMCLNLSMTIETNLNRHRDLLGPMARAKSVRSAVDSYYQSFPSLGGSPERFVELARQRNASLSQVKHWLVSHASLSLHPLFTFTLDNLIENYPVSIEVETLREVLDIWSLRFGDLRDQPPEHLFLGNPVWEKPLIRLDDDTFFGRYLASLSAFAWS